MKRALSFFIFFLPLSGYSTIAIQKCMICHGKTELKRVEETGKIKYLYVDLTLLQASVHKKKVCTDCHADVIEIPHRSRPERVNCRRCHYKGNPEGAPQVDKYFEYEQSVHYLEILKGNKKAPLCQDCHGNHDVKKVEDPLSHVNKNKVAETCGKCHLKIYSNYTNSVHGVALLEKGIKESPTCTSCHGEHKIIRHEEPTSPTYSTNVPKTCGQCHSAVDIVGKYGISVEQVETFERSFHGIAGKYGERTVANCASCHGVHDILPAEDPRSSVNIANIPKTCGKIDCHPGANINYAKGKIHVNPHKRSSGIIYWVALFFKLLTAGTLLGLIAHIFLDLYRRSEEWRKQKKILSGD